MDESPPPFIVFRSPRATGPFDAKVERVDLYQLALDFTGKVELVLATTQARYFMKDRLDRNATSIAMLVAQAVDDRAPAGRRASYRKAHMLAVECSTVLDILARRSDIDLALVRAAQLLLSQLLPHLRDQSV